MSSVLSAYSCGLVRSYGSNPCLLPYLNAILCSGQSRRCPLCSQNVGEYLIHHIRSKYDFQKHYLTPLRTSPQPQVLALPPRGNTSTTRRPRREVQWGRNTRRVQEREAAAIDELERAIDKRRWVYRNGLYAKVSTDTEPTSSLR